MSEIGIQYLRKTINGMAISGLWDGYHFKNPIKKLLYTFYGHLIFSIFMFFNISQFIEIYYVATDVFFLMQNISVTLLYALVLLKAYTLHFRKKRVGTLMDKTRLAENRALKRPKNEIKVYYATMRHSNLITNWFWASCVIILISFAVARPLEYWYVGPQEMYHGKIPFLFSSWFPFDKYADGYYIIAFGFQLLSGTIGAYYVGAVDTTIVSFMIFAVGQFEMIQEAIKNLHIGQKSTEDMENFDVYEDIVELIKHHIRVIEYVEDLNDLINLIMFLNFLICSLMICAVGIEGIMAGPSIRLALSVEYLCSLLIEVFYYYWHANEITIASTNVGQAVGKSEWYRFLPQSKKALILIMLRSERPSQLSVGKFYYMSLSTYIMILKATYSYVALFREIYAKHK